VRNDISECDTGFVGFGWDKMSHIMELKAYVFEFFFLPNGFIDYMSHAPSFDVAKVRSSTQSRKYVSMFC
jgi:glycosyltransferase-like protein LARGE